MVATIELSPELCARLDRWSALDPDPHTRAELTRLRSTEPAEVAARFDGRLAFGTAGLRAPMGAGPTMMNRLVVRQTTAGLVRWLGDGRTVVVGYDARHNSDVFALDAAAVVGGAGGRAELLPVPVPTPVLALAVLDRRADAGVMITASHNPAADNGYKLYLADGIQLVGPGDVEIAAAIDRIADAMADPDISDAAASALIRISSDHVIELDTTCLDRHRVAAIGACVTEHRSVKTLYTAMHGVGGSQLVAAFEAAGFPPPTVVPEQFEPDPDFPTAEYPNPEEHGALDHAFAQADRLAAAGDPVDAILANDPDADRLAVAIPDRAGRWCRLSGDQVGVLLAEHLLRHTSGGDRLVSSSVVSSRLISAMAADAGITDVRTLTGFKWVARPIVDQPDKQFILGYEEALGYCVGDRVRDKDGISAAVVMAELLAEALASDETLWDRLDRLALIHGVYETAPVTLAFDGPDGDDRRRRAMANLRSEPPTKLAETEVESFEDLARGVRLPPTDAMVLDLVDRSRVIVRPSGTEPKLKAYLEVIEDVAEGEAVERGTERAKARLQLLAEAVEELLGSLGV